MAVLEAQRGGGPLHGGLDAPHLFGRVLAGKGIARAEGIVAIAEGHARPPPLGPRPGDDLDATPPAPMAIGRVDGALDPDFLDAGLWRQRPSQEPVHADLGVGACQLFEQLLQLLGGIGQRLHLGFGERHREAVAAGIHRRLLRIAADRDFLDEPGDAQRGVNGVLAGVEHQVVAEVVVESGRGHPQRPFTGHETAELRDAPARPTPNPRWAA